MTIPDEGYIKYTCNWQKAPPPPAHHLTQLHSWRTQLYQKGFIGRYDNGIGYGNLSIRSTTNPQQFIVSGTQTGGLPDLTAAHYTLVTTFDLERNTLTCRGEIKASSESLTHAAIYQANPDVCAVIHVHHRRLWECLMDKVPTTPRHCAYGTPEMAYAIRDICQNPSLASPKILVMSGHEEGIITFGKDLAEAGTVLLAQYRKELAVV
ncbi:MAG: class II aldolase/adducin family protein [Jaaginema sp. PMC 1079.18]|nr:class II aldolase/adducin family protein [Jaaginema sp. PMC 1080.18]MEC4853917.1 class II aldolase/adducin family protein [Jaaginema sp. PMC 1079.18]MEC4866175.1 class II aldolase/adducin family protein [Jaaginema sp. PMC 1078.18]